jgi:hypothetical protein
MWGGWAVIITIMISSSEAFSDAFILPYYPPCITHYLGMDCATVSTHGGVFPTNAGLLFFGAITTPQWDRLSAFLWWTRCWWVPGSQDRDGSFAETGRRLFDSIVRGDLESSSAISEASSAAHGHNFPHSFDGVFSLAWHQRGQQRKVLLLWSARDFLSPTLPNWCKLMNDNMMCC